eukprot:gnl/MRDRNA2_/MRDRNA2_112754_c0_seq1.p1 gnl/MRDRNA2_/MRDRNA2_112754_c0~~gnl/MRDRNA2_/MRDRNA2_112754_c0_seq1.p1  ORF type:complete len:223 (-),score=44.79 gnl/MRDRNA2_/MRDRNA2_112754_c0_seq1:116-748(-)
MVCYLALFWLTHLAVLECKKVEIKKNLVAGESNCSVPEEVQWKNTTIKPIRAMVLPNGSTRLMDSLLDYSDGISIDSRGHYEDEIGSDMQGVNDYKTASAEGDGIIHLNPSLLAGTSHAKLVPIQSHDNNRRTWVFDNFDHNHDGALETKEVSFLVDEVLDASSVSDEQLLNVVAAISSLDRNKDGKVTRWEFEHSEDASQIILQRTIRH